MDNKYNGKISFQQFAAMLFVGLFSPITRALPSSAAESAGASAWLAPLLAFPLVFGFTAFLAAVKRRCRAGEGFSELAVRLAGARNGRLCGAVSAAGRTVYCGFVLRCGAERLVSAVYANAHSAPFIIITAAVCAVAACGELRWRARSAQAFFPLLAPPVAAILVFSMHNVRAERVWPPDVTRPRGILRAALQSSPRFVSPSAMRSAVAQPRRECAISRTVTALPPETPL